MISSVRAHRLVVFLLGWLALSAAAGDQEEISYDIYSRNGCLAVWVNLAPYITAKSVSQLKDGIDLVVEYQLTLRIPKRFFGHQHVASKTGALHLAYRPATEDYMLTSLEESNRADRQFISLAALHQHLADSMETCLVALDSLDYKSRHTLTLKVTTVSLTNINLASDGNPGEETGSALKYLFRQFLVLTGYGLSDNNIQHSLSDVK